MSVRLTALGVKRAGRTVLDGLDLELSAGSTTAIVGPNGSGKSTLLQAIAGLVPASQGRVSVGGLDPHATGRRALAAHVSLMPQAVEFPFAWTALDVALMGRTSRRSALALPSAAELEGARTALERVGVAHLVDRPVTQLSGGERQRVLLAMQLVQDAAVVLLDEPTSALDFAGIRSVLEAVSELRDAGRTVVVALHDLNLAARHFDRCVLLDRGRIADQGAPPEVVRGEPMRRAYEDAFEVLETTAGPIVLPANPRAEP